eukprot:tig00001339_g8277.t1
MAKVVPLAEENVALNAADVARRGGSCAAAELEWGAPGYEARLREQENELPSPSMPHFVRACRLLCDPARTRVIISFEVRTAAARGALLAAAEEAFREVRRVAGERVPAQFRHRDHLELFELLP